MNSFEFIPGKLYSFKEFHKAVVISSRPIYERNSLQSDWISELEQGDMFLCLHTELNGVSSEHQWIKILTTGETPLCGYLYCRNDNKRIEDLFRLEM